MMRILLIGALATGAMAVGVAEAAPATPTEMSRYRERIARLTPGALSPEEVITLLTFRFGRPFAFSVNRDGSVDYKVQDGSNTNITYMETIVTVPGPKVELDQ